MTTTIEGNPENAKLSRRWLKTLEKWWWEFKRGTWPKEIPKPPNNWDRSERNLFKNKWMRKIEQEIGRRYIEGKV